MLSKNRFKKVKEIYDHAKMLKSNISRLTCILAVTSDKTLTKFHKEYLDISPHKSLEKKHKEDYKSYLELCKKYNEQPRIIGQDFYKHKDWLINENK